MNHAAQIVGLGEILWDVFPDSTKFGGAPANFACCAAELAASISVHMVSGVGKDDLGDRAIRSLQQHGVETSCVARLDQVTGRVDVTLDEAGNASYEFAANSAWDNVPWNDQLGKLAADTRAVCCGTLGQRCETSRKTIQRFVATAPDDALKIFDINLRPPFYSDEIIRQSIELANVLKLNDDELPVVAEMFHLTGDPESMLRQLAERQELRCIALTLGESGAGLLIGDAFHRSKGVKTNVMDTVGAGDSFTAAMTIGLLQNRPIGEIADQAAKVAAYVCSQPGATPPIPNELKW